MRLFGNCDALQLQKDLGHLITEHKRIEGLRRIEAEERLHKLERGLDEVTAFIASHGTIGEES
jgi:hypothetical protein